MLNSINYASINNIARVPNGKRSADSVDLHEDSLDSMYMSPAKRTKFDVTGNFPRVDISAQGSSFLTASPSNSSIENPLLLSSMTESGNNSNVVFSPEVIVINSLFE